MPELALLGGRKAKTKPFPHWPMYDEKERRALTEVLESRVWWRTPGTKTLEFERAFAAFHGARHGIAVTNGTAALEVVMAALNVGPGDEVIVPDFTFIATASAVLFAGALPVMVDVLPDTYCIDSDLVEAGITQRTKAIIAVHMGGHPADLDRLSKIARDRGIALVEDSSHAHASEWQGAVLSAQLTRLDEQTAHRHKNARLLDRLLGAIAGITPQKLASQCTRNGQYAYIFHVDRSAFGGISTEKFIAAMNAEGIPNQASYPPLHALDVFKSGEYRRKLTGRQAEEPHPFLKRDFPETHRAAWETVWIPQPVLLGDEQDMHEIATALKKIQNHAGDLGTASVPVRETA